MSNFKAKMHQIRFPLGSSQRSADPIAVRNNNNNNNNNNNGFVLCL